MSVATAIANILYIEQVEFFKNEGNSSLLSVQNFSEN